MNRGERSGQPRSVLWRAAELMLGPWAEEVLGDLLERSARGTAGTLSEWRLGADAFVLALQIRLRRRPPRPTRPRGRQTGRLRGVSEELRYALRRLGRSPMFALLASLTIAVGVAGVVGVLTVVDGVLLRPLPYQEPDRLVAVFTSERDGAELRNPSSPGDFLDWQRSARGLARLSAATVWNASFSDQTRTQGSSASSTPAGRHLDKIVGLRVSRGLLAMLGVDPLLGRLFDPDDADNTVVISYDTWQQRLAGRSDVLGREIVLEGRPHVVIGVMPGSFAFPPFWATDAELWAPLELGSEPDRGARFLRVFARLEEGASADSLAQRLRSVHRELAERYPESHGGTGVVVEELREPAIASARPALLLLATGAVLLLALLATNLAGLLLARGLERGSALATQLALGASRRRVVLSSMCESLLVVLAGGLLGTAIGALGLELFKAVGAGYVSRLQEVEVSASTWWISLGVMAGLGLAVGMVPGIQLAFDTESRLVGRASRFRRSDHARRVLVGGEVALTTCLLLLAGLVGRSFERLASQDLGFRVEQVTTIDADFEQSVLEGDGASGSGLATLIEELERLPMVERVGAVNHLPLAGDVWRGRVFAIGFSDPDDDVRATLRVASPGYFDVMSIRLRAGRLLDETDRAHTEPVAVINRTLADTLFPDKDPVGATVARGRLDDEAPRVRVVGVVENVKQSSLEEVAPPEIYFPFSQSPFPRNTEATLALRSAGRGPVDSEALVSALSKAAPGIALRSPTTLREVVSRDLREERARALVLLLFAVIAILLAAAGLFGIVAFAAHQRRQEVGLRMALGGHPWSVVWLVLREGAVVAIAGALAGGVAAILLTPFTREVLFETSSFDFSVWAVVAVAMIALTLAAGLVPALRASRTSPSSVLDGR